MTFEGQYLTYNEYRELGGTLSQTPFYLLEFEARKKIDVRTFNRLKNCEEIPQEVKLCEYKLINSLESYAISMSNVANNGSVASESTDGYSISYITADRVSEVIKSKGAELDDIIRDYLLYVVVNGEHIMYCGVK